jgi:hypothetical protein
MKDQNGNAKTDDYATDERFQKALVDQMPRLYLHSLFEEDFCDRLSARHFGLIVVCDRVVNHSPNDLFIHHGANCESPFQSKITSDPSIRKLETETLKAICTEYLFLRPVPVIRLRRQDDQLASLPVKPDTVTPQAHYRHDSKRESGE